MERNKVFDATKYILIILVVIGHFIEPTKYIDSITQHLYCLIYSFHMPLFVMISGYFYKHRDTKQEIKKCIPLLEICLLSHIGFLLIRYRGHISLLDLINYIGDPAWYLLSLIYWRIGTGWLLKRLNARQILIASLFLNLISFMFIRYSGFMSIGRTISFYPFFLLGYCLKEKVSYVTQKHWKLFVGLGLLATTFIIATASVLQFQIEYQRASVFELGQYTDIATWQIFIYRYLLLVCSLFISALMLIMINKSIAVQRLSVYGQSTLFIYYIQTFMFAIISIIDITLLQSLLIAFISIPILTYISKFKITKYMMNPVCSQIRL